MKILAIHKHSGHLYSLTRYNHSTVIAMQLPKHHGSLGAYASPRYSFEEIPNYFYLLNELHKETMLLQLYVLNRLKTGRAIC